MSKNDFPDVSATCVLLSYQYFYFNFSSVELEDVHCWIKFYRYNNTINDNILPASTISPQLSRYHRSALWEVHKCSVFWFSVATQMLSPSTLLSLLELCWWLVHRRISLVQIYTKKKLPAVFRARCVNFCCLSKSLTLKSY